METIDIKKLEAEVNRNEAEVLYRMYKIMGLSNKSADIASFSKGPANMVLSGRTLTLRYADGSISTYTEPI